jgi:hypothetical protein
MWYGGYSVVNILRKPGGGKKNIGYASLAFMCRDSRQGREATAWERGMFISLLAQRNEPKKGPPGTCPAEGGMPCAPRCCRGFANSAFASNSANPLFGSLSGARLRANGIFPSPICPAAPRRRGRKRRGNCLRAKPEFFRVPPSARSKGSPQGQDWLGCRFLVSSFGHAKEEKMNRRKGLPFPCPEFSDSPIFS